MEASLAREDSGSLERDLLVDNLFFSSSDFSSIFSENALLPYSFVYFAIDFWPLVRSSFYALDAGLVNGIFSKEF